MGFLKNNDTAFKKGNISWNKGLKGIHLSPDTEFKKGQFTGENHPSWKGGVQKNKTDCVYLYDGTNKRVRRPKKIYEDKYGAIPKGWILYHLDQNKDNDDIDNLIAMPRAILVKINANRININYHELTLAIEQFKNK
jgi:hypothetical protein